MKIADRKENKNENSKQTTWGQFTKETTSVLYKSDRPLFLQVHTNLNSVITGLHVTSLI